MKKKAKAKVTVTEKKSYPTMFLKENKLILFLQI